MAFSKLYNIALDCMYDILRSEEHQQFVQQEACEFFLPVKAILFKAHYEGSQCCPMLPRSPTRQAAKTIAGYLSHGTSRKREGFSVYNKIFEFNIQLWGQNCQMLMTSVIGHLLGYEFTGAYSK